MNVNQLEGQLFFEQTQFEEISLQDMELIGKHFEGCLFSNCNLSGAVLSECTFLDCKFVDCNLSLLKIPHSDMGDTCFSGCKMVGIDWTAAQWRKSTTKRKRLFPLSFQKCLLDYSIFIAMDLYGVRFQECSLREVGFESANMEQSNFTNCDLSRAIFADTDLLKADLSQARNYTINAKINNITKAKFSMPEATALLYALDIVIE